MTATHTIDTDQLRNSFNDLINYLNELSLNIEDPELLSNILNIQNSLAYHTINQDKPKNIELYDEAYIVIIDLITQAQSLSQTIHNKLKDRFSLFQTDTQLRNRINLTFEHYEIIARENLDSWFKKVYQHFSSIVLAIGNDLKKQNSWASNLNYLYLRLLNKPIDKKSTNKSIKQCKELLSSFSKNKDHISGLQPISDAITNMIGAPYLKIKEWESNDTSLLLALNYVNKERLKFNKELVNNYPQSIKVFIDNDLLKSISLNTSYVEVFDLKLALNTYLEDYVILHLTKAISSFNQSLERLLMNKNISLDQILESFREESLTVKKNLKRQLLSILTTYIKLIKTRIIANFYTFDAYLLSEQKLLELLYDKVANIDQKIIEIKQLLTNNN